MSVASCQMPVFNHKKRDLYTSVTYFSFKMQICTITEGDTYDIGSGLRFSYLRYRSGGVPRAIAICSAVQPFSSRNRRTRAQSASSKSNCSFDSMHLSLADESSGVIGHVGLDFLDKVSKMHCHERNR